MSGQAFPLKNKWRANMLENRGKGWDRVKIVKRTFETASIQRVGSLLFRIIF
jgi:hypothetical protein